MDRKSNIEHSLGPECVLQRSSAIHFENILLIERITVVVVARGGVGGGGGVFTSKRPLSLQAIFNWTLIRHLPGSSSFWSWRRSWQKRACLKARGRLVHALVLCFNPSVDGEKERYSPVLFLTCKATIRRYSYWQAFHTTLKSSIEMQLPQRIKRRPDKTKCHD